MSTPPYHDHAAPGRQPNAPRQLRGGEDARQQPHLNALMRQQQQQPIPERPDFQDRAIARSFGKTPVVIASVPRFTPTANSVATSLQMTGRSRRGSVGAESIYSLTSSASTISANPWASAEPRVATSLLPMTRSGRRQSDAAESSYSLTRSASTVSATSWASAEPQAPVGVGQVVLDEHGFVVLPDMQCDFHFLGCRQTRALGSSWHMHSMSHFEDHSIEPPKYVTCPFDCGWGSSFFTGRDAWLARSDHIEAKHFLAQPRDWAKPDEYLLRYLFSQGIIDEQEFKRLFRGPPPPRTQPSSYTTHDPRRDHPRQRPSYGGARYDPRRPVYQTQPRR